MSRSDIFHLAGGTIQANSSQYIKQQGTATASALGYKASGSKTTRLIHRGLRSVGCFGSGSSHPRCYS